MAETEEHLRHEDAREEQVQQGITRIDSTVPDEDDEEDMDEIMRKRHGMSKPGISLKIADDGIPKNIGGLDKTLIFLFKNLQLLFLYPQECPYIEGDVSDMTEGRSWTLYILVNISTMIERQYALTSDPNDIRKVIFIRRLVLNLIDPQFHREKDIKGFQESLARALSIQADFNAFAGGYRDHEITIARKKRPTTKNVVLLLGDYPTSATDDVHPDWAEDYIAGYKDKAESSIDIEEFYALSLCHFFLYLHFRARHDLEQAIKYANRPFEAYLHGKWGPLGWIVKLSQFLLARWNLTQDKDQSDLDSALQHFREAQQYLQDQPSLLFKHAVAACGLVTKAYRHLPREDLLDEAFRFTDVAGKCCAGESNGEQARLHKTVAYLLGAKYDRTANFDFAAKVILEIDKSLEDLGNPGEVLGAKAIRAKYQLKQYLHTNTISSSSADIQQLIKFTTEEMPKDVHPEDGLLAAEAWYAIWKNFEISVSDDKYRCQVMWLVKAFVAIRGSSSELIFQGDADLLAKHFLMRGTILKALSDCKADIPLHGNEASAVHYWMRCWSKSGASLETRLQGNHHAACELFREGRVTEAWNLLKRAVELIILACPRSFDIRDRQYLVPLLHKISVDACAIALRLGKTSEALEILEQGRGLLTDRSVQAEDSVAKLESQHPQLFAAFRRSRMRVLGAGESSNTTIATNSEEDNAAGLEPQIRSYDTVLDEIRRQPGFDDFLRPMAAIAMQKLASPSPVIVLVGSRLHFYAVIVKTSGTIVIDLDEMTKEAQAANFDIMRPPLPSDPPHIRVGVRKFRPDEATDPLNSTDDIEDLRNWFHMFMDAIITEGQFDDSFRSQVLLEVLCNLWKLAVRPIADVMKWTAAGNAATEELSMEGLMRHTDGVHATWIRTGVFSRLPVHIAIDDDGVSLLYRVTSSFVSNFRALAQSKKPRSIAVDRPQRGIMVAMAPKKPSPPMERLSIEDEDSATSLQPDSKSDERSSVATKIVNRPRTDQPRLSSDENEETVPDVNANADVHETRSVKPSSSPFINNARQEANSIGIRSREVSWSVLERPSPEDFQEKYLSVGPEFLHIICHGQSNPVDPMKSHLVLWKSTSKGKGRRQRLELSELVAWKVQQTLVAFLSACSTADAQVTTLFDENLDLANVLNVAGVQSVIGALWPVESNVCPEFAGLFWRCLLSMMEERGAFDGYLVARALQFATIMVSQRDFGNMLAWAGFVHIGGINSLWSNPLIEHEICGFREQGQKETDELIHCFVDRTLYGERPTVERIR